MYTILAQMLKRLAETVLEEHGDLLFSIWEETYFPKLTKEASRNVVLLLCIKWYPVIAV